MSAIIHLDVQEHAIGPRNVEAQDIIHIMPSIYGGCFVYLRSIGIVKCRQTVEEISKQIMEAARL